MAEFDPVRPPPPASGGGPEEPLVLIDRTHPQTAVITLNRPERMNSMSFEQMVPLHAAFAEVADDNATTCVVLTGAWAASAARLVTAATISAAAPGA